MAIDCQQHHQEHPAAMYAACRISTPSEADGPSPIGASHRPEGRALSEALMTVGGERLKIPWPTRHRHNIVRDCGWLAMRVHAVTDEGSLLQSGVLGREHRDSACHP